MILLLDNYDSFTENVADLFRQLGATLHVVRNDKISIEEIVQASPQAIVISPGPGRPEEAGITLPLIAHFEKQLPLLGICLGHQAIAQHYGASIVRGIRPMHGKTSLVCHAQQGVFQGLPNPFSAMRYHSLIASREKFPSELEITAWTEEDEIMGFRHRGLPVEGVQFHPESILTPDGVRLIENFLQRIR